MKKLLNRPKKIERQGAHRIEDSELDLVKNFFTFEWIDFCGVGFKTERSKKRKKILRKKVFSIFWRRCYNRESTNFHLSDVKKIKFIKLAVSFLEVMKYQFSLFYRYKLFELSATKAFIECIISSPYFLYGKY